MKPLIALLLLTLAACSEKPAPKIDTDTAKPCTAPDGSTFGCRTGAPK